MDFSMDHPQALSGSDELLQIVRFQILLAPGDVPFDPELGLDLESLLFTLSDVGLSSLAGTLLNQFRRLDPRFAEAEIYFESEPDRHLVRIWLLLKNGESVSMEVRQ